jgi:hypothetical protein
MPNLRTGADFGCSSFISALTRMMLLGSITPAKRRLIRGSEGGSEHVNFTLHVLHCQLVHEGVFDEIVWARLPPDHSHDIIDRLWSVLEGWLGHPSCPRQETLHEMLEYLRNKLASTDVARDTACKCTVPAKPLLLSPCCVGRSDSQYASNKIDFVVLVVNYAFTEFFDGHVRAAQIGR